MASKKDLVEAHAYNRRRLVTAFVSGAPGGREVEPSRPAKTIIAGAVLAGLVVGGGALTGVISPTVDDDWAQASLVVAEDSGARYLATQGNLFPVTNTTSARLLLPPGEFDVVFASNDDLAEVDLRDTTLGLPDAPDAVPDPDDLVQTGWVSCVGPRQKDDSEEGALGTSLNLSRTPTAAPVPGQALVAQAGGTTAIVSGNFAYPVPGARDQVLATLGLGPGAAEVSTAWLDQATDGDPLQPVSIAGVGRPLNPAQSGLPRGTVNGDVLTVSGTGQRFLATASGAYPLTEVQYRMYKLGNAPAQDTTVPVAPAKLATELPAGLAATTTWPVAVPTAYAGGAIACLSLDANPRTEATATLARPLVGFLDTRPDGALGVDDGRGALAAVPGSSVFLVDSFGKAYPLGDEVSRQQLGFADTEPVFAPDAWITALGDGPELSARAVREASGVQVAAPPGGAGSSGAGASAARS